MPATAEGGKGVLALFVGLRADDHSAGPANETGAVCREERPVVSPLQRARWRAGGGVRQRNAPLPMVCNCNRSIVANGLYPYSPDHHSTRPSASARLPCATLRKSSPPRVVMARPLGDWSPSFFSHMASRNILSRSRTLQSSLVILPRS